MQSSWARQVARSWLNDAGRRWGASEKRRRDHWVNSWGSDALFPKRDSELLLILWLLVTLLQLICLQGLQGNVHRQSRCGWWRRRRRYRSRPHSGRDSGRGDRRNRGYWGTCHRTHLRLHGNLKNHELWHLCISHLLWKLLSQSYLSLSLKKNVAETFSKWTYCIFLGEVF